MNSQDYDKLRYALHQQADDIQTAKRPGYTRGDDDVLKNFKSVAERIPLKEVTPEVVWVVYFLKHIDAITTAMCRPDLPVSEAIDGRFCDAYNYLDLGYGLLAERSGNNQLPVPEQLTLPFEDSPVPAKDFETERDPGDERDYFVDERL